MPGLRPERAVVVNAPASMVGLEQVVGGLASIFRRSWGGGEDGTTGPQDYGTTGPQDYGTTGPRDHGTTGPRDDGVRGCGSAGRLPVCERTGWIGVAGFGVCSRIFLLT
jgi:hypothetical protein